MGQFFAGPINKAVPSFRNRVKEYVNGDGIHSEHFPLLKEVYYGDCAVWNS